MKLKRALLVVDIQNDFCSKGVLGIREGDKIIPMVNRYIKLFSKAGLPVFASRDWHPKETKHFKKFGGVWPIHCVQNTKGAAFHSKLKLSKESINMFKGKDTGEDSYSVFQAEDQNGKLFENVLKSFGVQELYVCGLGIEHCIKYTAIDAVKRGVKAYVLTDAIKGVNAKPEDSEEAVYFLTKMGIKIALYKDVENAFK